MKRKRDHTEDKELTLQKEIDARKEGYFSTVFSCVVLYYVRYMPQISTTFL
jgi:hypothetical protein